MSAFSVLIINTIETFSRYTHSHGLSIIFFAFLLKSVLLPITLYGMRWQERFKKNMKKAKEEIAALKITDPADRDDKILDIYQGSGITFLNQCKALLPLLIQLPLLIAFYRTVTHWEAMADTSFLWIEALSQPDSFIAFNFSLPWLGASFNLLPLVLFAVNTSEVLLFRDAETGLKSFSMPLVFFFLFYPFPASCMIFWVMLNILHVPERYYFQRFLSTENQR